MNKLFGILLGAGFILLGLTLSNQAFAVDAESSEDRDLGVKSDIDHSTNHENEDIGEVENESDHDVLHEDHESGTAEAHESSVAETHDSGAHETAHSEGR